VGDSKESCEGTGKFLGIAQARAKNGDVPKSSHLFLRPFWGSFIFHALPAALRPFRQAQGKLFCILSSLRGCSWQIFFRPDLNLPCTSSQELQRLRVR
jgi:hypothetical protein